MAYSKQAQVMPHAHRAQPHIKIGEPDPEQTHPGPEHVAAIETAHAAIRLMAERRPGKLIDAAADKMSQRMTSKRIAAEKNHVQSQHDGSDTNPKGDVRRCPAGKPHRLPNIVREENQKDQR